jgi:hypothetical protein
VGENDDPTKKRKWLEGYSLLLQEVSKRRMNQVQEIRERERETKGPYLRSDEPDQVGHDLNNMKLDVFIGYNSILPIRNQLSQLRWIELW